MFVEVKGNLERAIKEFRKKRTKEGIETQFKIRGFPKPSERRKYKAQFALARRSKRKKLEEKYG